MSLYAEASYKSEKTQLNYDFNYSNIRFRVTSNSIIIPILVGVTTSNDLCIDVKFRYINLKA